MSEKLNEFLGFQGKAKEAPVVVRGKDGRVGVRFKDLESGNLVTPYKAYDDMSDAEQKELEKYLRPGGYQGYKLSPEDFVKREAPKPQPQPPKPKPKPDPTPPVTPPVTPTTPKPDSGKGLSPAPSLPGTPERNKLEAEIEAANKARREAEAAKPAKPKPVPVKSTRQQKLDKINADKTLTPEQKWEKANPGLAAARRERKAIRGTSETDNPLMQGLRSGLPAAKTALDTTAFKADLARSGIKPSAYSSLLNNPRRMKYQQPSVEKVQDAYDVVLDYLLSEGHVDTVEEAHYVMMQLDSEYIQSIVDN
jgi:hypothetical protein